MNPYEMAAGSLFMAKEAGLQKVLQSIGDATGSDPTRLQDALVGLAGGGLLGGGVGAAAGGGKGAVIGGLLGGAGGAAGGYAGSPYVREMLSKLLSKEAPAEMPELSAADAKQQEQIIGSRPDPTQGISVDEIPPIPGGETPGITEYSVPDQMNLGMPVPQQLSMMGEVQGSPSPLNQASLGGELDSGLIGLLDRASNPSAKPGFMSPTDLAAAQAATMPGGQ